MLKHTDTISLYGASSPALPLYVVETKDIYAVIAQQGAQILEFKTKGQDLLWLSPNATFEESKAKGKAVRGGIPVCAPWFGRHPTKAMHGFVRNNLWELVEQEKIDGDKIRLVFEYAHTANEVFELSFKLVYTMVFSKQLEVTMEVSNLSGRKMPFSWAFHTYHPVSDLKAVRVSGLEGLEYQDATDGFKPVHQDGLVHFEGEVDRVYENVPEVQTIIGQPSLKISGKNCPTAIIWNPGADLGAKMPDVGADRHLGFICVERGAAFGNSWELDAGEVRQSNLTISLI